MHERVNRGFKLKNITIWNSKKYNEEIPKTSNYDQTYLRMLYGELNTNENEIMNTLSCMYVYYTNIFVTEAFGIYNLMLVMPDERMENQNLNKELIFRYIDISLMMLATIYNEEYQPPEWMIYLVLYFNEIQSIYDNVELFQSETKKIIQILQNACDECDLNSENQPAITIPLEDMENEYNPENVKLYMRWQRELVLIQFAHSTRGKYVKKIYSSLIHIAYILEINAEILPYSNFNDFIPSKWLFGSIKFDKNTLDKFRWDKIQVDKNGDEHWKMFSEKELAEINLKNVTSEIDMDDRLNNSFFIYSRLLNFVVMSVARLIKAFIRQCFDIRTSTQYIENNANNEANKMFAKHCV
ncbi:Hypothetical protein CINCED_3A000361, partial [Cinara cedri]